MNHRTAPFTLVVLISGNGSNLQALIDAIAAGTLPAVIGAVISNRSDAYGLERARRAGIATRVIDHRAYADRSAFDAALQQAIDDHHPDLVVLAGFMRILTPALVNHYATRMVNIHPSLLPAFTGLDTHQRALDAGVAEHGVSVHYVTDELDGGPVIARARVPVLADDDARTLAQRVQQQEHRLYPRTVALIAEGRLRTDNRDIFLDEKRLTEPLDLTTGQPGHAHRHQP